MLKHQFVALDVLRFWDALRGFALRLGTVYR
jgi:hypothetical protein